MKKLTSLTFASVLLAGVFSANGAIVFTTDITTFTDDGGGLFSTPLITTADGASFNIQLSATATNADNSAGVVNFSSRLAVTGGTADNRIDAGEALTVSGFTVTNFTPGSDTLSAADVTNIGISSFAYIASNQGNDQGSFSIDGGTATSWEEFDVAQTPAITGHDPSNQALNVVTNNGSVASSITFTSTANEHALNSLTITGMTPIPEPTSAALLGLGGLALLTRRGRK